MILPAPGTLWLRARLAYYSAQIAMLRWLRDQLSMAARERETRRDRRRGDQP
jgi:hypothetical protein